jgi:Tic22-like family
VKQENPKLGRESSVMQVGMDAVYQFATAPRAETGMQGVIFRFMPDPWQVDAAVKVWTIKGSIIMHVNHSQITKHWDGKP